MTAQQERKQHIRAFMQAHYTDERLAQLLAHAQDGKLDYNSCCCFIGVATATHALCGEKEYGEGRGGMVHYGDAKKLIGAVEAERAFAYLWDTRYWNPENPETRTLRQRRNAILIPMIRAEMKRRAALAAPVEVSTTDQRVAEPVL